MKTLKKNKTVKNQLYSKYEKSGRKSLREVLEVWKLARESVADLLVELLMGEFVHWKAKGIVPMYCNTSR